jgi:hypothetical protein
MAGCGGTGTSNGGRQGYAPVKEPCTDVAVSRGYIGISHNRCTGALTRLPVSAVGCVGQHAENYPRSNLQARTEIVLDAVVRVGVELYVRILL